MTMLPVIVALLISAAVIVWTTARIAGRRFDPAEDLPLGMCNLTALLAPAQAFSQSPFLTAWVICVGGPAGIVSMLAPDLGPRHDLATHVKFWIVHPGLVAHALLCGALYPPRWDVSLGLWILCGLAALVLVALAANRILPANYLFLRSKPATASPLDWFGGWPSYLLPMAGAACATIGLAFVTWTAAWPR